MGARVGIAGITGYTGVELCRILAGHPDVRLVAAAGGQRAGQPLSAVWPGLSGLIDLPVDALDTDELASRCDVVFLALPHGVSAPVARALLARDVLVVDLGADFRLRDPAVYAAAYESEHPCPELLERAVYGLPELHRDELREARLVANPGCYPTATALALLPLVRAGLVDSLVADCLSGVSGAGRSPGPRNLYGEVAESAVAYGVAGGHRHRPEIEQTLGCPIIFTPHLVPMIRGMLATTHGHLRSPSNSSEILGLYQDFYAEHPMIVLRDAPPSTAEVRGTNRAHIHVALDANRGVVTAICAIDNLVKGAAGQAVQCMNLALGLPETAGLPLFPLIP